MLPENVYGVVLAGGSGTRFWPKSRHLKPKQLCAIGEAEKTMLEITLARFDGFIPPERRIIVTHQDQVRATKEIVKDSCDIVMAEPEAKNTANAIAFAAFEILNRAPKSIPPPIMVSVHADHVIQNVGEFHEVLRGAVDIAADGHLALLGIVPKYPETGYGYIEKGPLLEKRHYRQGFKVNSFREKPDLDLAKKYLENGTFFWNAGLFVWRIDIILEELKKNAPEIIKTFSELFSGGKVYSKLAGPMLKASYERLPKISIDNAVLELSQKVAMVEADIGWQDIGSWNALTECCPPDKKGNLVFGDVMLLDCKNTTVDTRDVFVAAIGLKDMVVVYSDGAILVCPKSRAQDVKLIVEELKKTRRDSLV